MAVEAARGCGYRKVGGLYMVGPSQGYPCLRMPANVGLCPCCGQGIQFSRGFRWIDASQLIGDCVKAGLTGLVPDMCRWVETASRGSHLSTCPFRDPRVGLLWVGAQFYTPESFQEEASRLGISKRITAVPKDFRVGLDWVLLAHKKAGRQLVWHDAQPGEQTPLDVELIRFEDGKQQLGAWESCPAVFMAFRPSAIEKVVTKKMLDEMTEQQRAADSKRGISYAVVPEDDPDHRGTVYDAKKGPLDPFHKALDELERMAKGFPDDPGDCFLDKEESAEDFKSDEPDESEDAEGFEANEKRGV